MIRFQPKQFLQRDAKADTPGDAGMGGGRIRCPLCKWQPRRHDRWSCSCGCSWNTFDTGGKCPACATQWKTTQCMRCGEWSLHTTWYDHGEPNAL